MVISNSALFSCVGYGLLCLLVQHVFGDQVCCIMIGNAEMDFYKFHSSNAFVIFTSLNMVLYEIGFVNLCKPQLFVPKIISWKGIFK